MHAGAMQQLETRQNYKTSLAAAGSGLGTATLCQPCMMQGKPDQAADLERFGVEGKVQDPVDLLHAGHKHILRGHALDSQLVAHQLLSMLSAALGCCHALGKHKGVFGLEAHADAGCQQLPTTCKGAGVWCSMQDTVSAQGSAL